MQAVRWQQGAGAGVRPARCEGRRGRLRRSRAAHVGGLTRRCVPDGVRRQLRGSRRHGHAHGGDARRFRARTLKARAHSASCRCRPELDLHGTWKNFRWPLVGKSIAVQSTGGEFGMLRHPAVSTCISRARFRPSISTRCRWRWKASSRTDKLICQRGERRGVRRAGHRFRRGSRGGRRIAGR